MAIQIRTSPGSTRIKTGDQRWQGDRAVPLLVNAACSNGDDNASYFLNQRQHRYWRIYQQRKIRRVWHINFLQSCNAVRHSLERDVRREGYPSLCADPKFKWKTLAIRKQKLISGASSIHRHGYKPAVKSNHDRSASGPKTLLPRKPHTFTSEYPHECLLNRSKARKFPYSSGLQWSKAGRLRVRRYNSKS